MLSHLPISIHVCWNYPYLVFSFLFYWGLSKSCLPNKAREKAYFRYCLLVSTSAILKFPNFVPHVWSVCVHINLRWICVNPDSQSKQKKNVGSCWVTTTPNSTTSKGVKNHAEKIELFLYHSGRCKNVKIPSTTGTPAVQTSAALKFSANDFHRQSPLLVSVTCMFLSPHSTSHHQYKAQDFALFTSFIYLLLILVLPFLPPSLNSHPNIFPKTVWEVILPQFLQRKISLLEDNWSSIFFYYSSSLQFRFWLSMSFHSFSSAFFSCQWHGRTTRSFLDS